VDKESILLFLKTHKKELQERFSIEKIALFGSYAKDCATKESDIDIYIEFKNKNFKNIAGVWDFLEEKLGKKIDLFYKHNNMKEFLKESIKKEAIYG
jgi:predicted nucleotidyltransferase